MHPLYSLFTIEWDIPLWIPLVRYTIYKGIIKASLKVLPVTLNIQWGSTDEILCMIKARFCR